ncbi:hypothetical protein Aduo_010538 [Ancylostoma duodenale]
MTDERPSQTTSEKKSAEPDIVTELVDILMFCGLVLNSGPIWNFPQNTMNHGGAFFLFIYLIVVALFLFPMLHLELFVGQRHQTHICKVFRSYGKAYEGFGVVVFVLTFMRSQFSIQESYTIFTHLGNVFVNVTSLISCRGEMFRGNTSCTSLYNFMECEKSDKNKSHYVFENDTCEARPNDVLSNAVSSIYLE